MPAEIYIFRHGIEAPPETPGLSEYGLARVRREARGLAWMGVQFDLILTAADPASQQTAEALAVGILPRPPIIETALLKAEGNADAAVELVWESKQTHRRIAVVGCEPVIGVLAARMIGAQQPFLFKKAAACRIDVSADSRCGQLRWFIPPKVLREMGGWV